MAEVNKFEQFLKNKEFELHQRDFQLSDIQKKVEEALGTTVHKIQSFKQGRLDYFNADYSKAEHINTGKMTAKGIAATTIYSGLSLDLGLFGSTKPLLDFSFNNIVSNISEFNNAAQSATEYREILQFISENLLSSPDLAASACKIAITAGTIGIGLYVANGVKRDTNIERICKNAEKALRGDSENFKLSLASETFKNIDSFYQYRRLSAVLGKQAKDYIKSIAAPVLLGIKNNITNPVLTKVRAIVGQSTCDSVSNALKSMIPDFLISDPNSISASDMILLLEEKIKMSSLNEQTNNPLSINVKNEISIITKDVYNTMQSNVLRLSIAVYMKQCLKTKKEIFDLEANPTFINKIKIKTKKSLFEEQLDQIKDIESLSKLDFKEGRLSRFTILSSAANEAIKFINQADANKLNSISYNTKKMLKAVNNFIQQRGKTIRKLYLDNGTDNNYYINDIDKMMITPIKSFKEIFIQSVNDMIEEKTKQQEQKKLETRAKLFSQHN